MRWLKNLFHKEDLSLGGAPIERPVQRPVQLPPLPSSPPSSASSQSRPARANWLELLDNSETAADLYAMLRTRSVADLEEICAQFPIAQLRLDWPSIQADFRNNKRCEIITVFAQILVRYNEIRSESPELLLPDSLPAPHLADVLMSRLMPFIRNQSGVDIAHGLRMRLYDFAMALMQAGRDSDALDCLLVSYPSTRTDHAFWICACRSNIALETKTLSDVSAALAAAKDLLDGKASIPQQYLQGVKDLYARLQAVTPVSDLSPLNAAQCEPLFSSDGASSSAVRFIRKYTEPGKQGHTNTYELYASETAAAARDFLMSKKVTQELYYMVVETPEGNWGVDIDGLYLERLLPWQTDLSCAQMDGYAASKMPRPEDLKNVAMGTRDNFVHEVICGVCHHIWLDGLRYQAQTVVQCPKCKMKNSVDSSNFVATIIGR